MPCNSSFADQKISLGRCPSTMAFLSLFFNQTNLPMSLGNLQPTLLPSNYITSHSLFYLHCLSTIKHCAILMPFIHNWTANLQQNFMMFQEYRHVRASYSFYFNRRFYISGFLSHISPSLFFCSCRRCFSPLNTAATISTESVGIPLQQQLRCSHNTDGDTF